MAKLRKGAALICVPCGREVVVSSAGIARSTIWCCGRPMKKGGTVKKKAKAGRKKKK